MAVALFAATVLCFLTALRLERMRDKNTASLLTCFVVSTLVVVLMFFKIRPLFCTTCNFIIPLGLSYYTFRLISYVVDVYWAKYSASENFTDFAAYVAFFPQMIAGPIQRESSFLPQLRESAVQGGTIEGLMRMALGFAKKSIVADNLGLFVGWGYGHLHSGSLLPALVAIVLYPVQLYMDFSGLVDIAIGSGLILGIDAPENFNAPFSAKSITEFWRRWHMTLTGWLRDYVFMPLRMLTRDWGETGLALSLTANMLLIALWHGISLGFVVYGLFHSLFLITETLTASRRKSFYAANLLADKGSAILGPFYVFSVVAVGSVFFRAPSLTAAAQTFSSLGSGIRSIGKDFWSLLAPPNHHAWVAFPAVVLLTIADACRRRFGFRLPALAPRYVRWSAYSGVAAMWILIAFMLMATEKGADPFVYALF